MKLSIFGLGYIGSVTGAAFAAEGHEVIGVDANPDKVALVNAGKSPVIEPGLEELVGKAVRGPQVEHHQVKRFAILRRRNGSLHLRRKAAGRAFSRRAHNAATAVGTYSLCLLI